MVVESPAPMGMAEHEKVGGHTPFDPTMLEVPDVADYRRPPPDQYEVRMKQQGGQSSICYRNDPQKGPPCEGDLFPLKRNVRHIMPPRPDRIRIPPSSWGTFE